MDIIQWLWQTVGNRQSQKVVRKWAYKTQIANIAEKVVEQRKFTYWDADKVETEKITIIITPIINKYIKYTC